MGGQLGAFLNGLILGQLGGATPDAGPAGDAAAGDAGVAADAAVQPAADAAAQAADAAADAAIQPIADAAAQAADAARAVADAAADAGIKAFDATRPVLDTTPAPPWVEYLVYGIIGALILFFLLRGLRSDPKAVEKTDIPRPTLPEGPGEERVEAEARREFGVAEAVVPADGKGRIRITRKPGAPKPSAVTEAARKPEVKAPAPQKAPEKRPPEKKPPEQRPPEKKAPEPAPPAKPAVEAAGKTLREGLARTRDGFVGKLGKLFGGAKTIDDDLLGELEEALFTADIGVRTSQKLVDLVHDALGKKDLDRPDKVWGALKKEIREILDVDAPPLDLDRAKPLVIMVVGVNGAGKTTSIGKLARKFRDEGKKVLLAAGDTFRAAAVEQLEVWGERAGAPVVKGSSGQDPSSVIFEAIKRAEREGYDVCIADTAGRLQAKVELMDELAKVHRVCGKASAGAPHEVWLVLDATNGQNAISQAKVFTDAVEVTGLVLTKLDGTAKGGVVIGISDEMRLPVRYIGIGEKVEDLRAFDPDAFAEALFAEA